jgi:hypothetical protein
MKNPIEFGLSRDFSSVRLRAKCENMRRTWPDRLHNNLHNNLAANAVRLRAGCLDGIFVRLLINRVRSDDIEIQTQGVSGAAATPGSPVFDMRGLIE